MGAEAGRKAERNCLCKSILIVYIHYVFIGLFSPSVNVLENAQRLFKIFMT